MSTAESTAEDVQLQLRSSIPGRERWEAAVLYRNPRLAALVEQHLGKEEDIHLARANPVTGRLLVRFRSDLASGEIEKRLRAALVAALEGLRMAAASPRKPSREPGMLTPVLVAASVPIAGSLALGLSPLAAPLWVAAGAVVAAGAAFRWWRRWRLRALYAGSSPRSLVRLLSYAGHHRGKIYLAVACSILDKLMDLMAPVLIGVAVTIVVTPAASPLAFLGITSIPAQLLALGAITALVWALESVFGISHRLLWHQLAQTLQHDLRVDAYTHVQRLELGFHEDESSGKLSLILNEDINQLQLFVSDEINHLIQVTTNVLAVGLIFFILAPSVAWIALLPVPVVIWGWIRYQDLVRPLYAKVRERAGIISDQLVNNLGGIATIKNYTAEDYEIRRIRGLSQDYVDANEPAIFLNSVFAPLIRMMILIGFGGTMVLGGLLVAAGTLQPGVYAMMVFLSQRFLWPLTSLGRTIDRYQRAMASIRRVLDLLEVPLGPAGGDRALVLEEVRGELAFQKVDFAYPGSPPIFRDFSLQISAGETIGVVGATGAGKTTLVKLLLHHYELDSGRIVVDGDDISQLLVRDLRRAIAVVSQDPFLFDGTVRENISYGHFEADSDAVVAAARLAEADDFIRQLPQQYETSVGERGVKLSGGQRQRLCIARALLREPPIMILDEATSAVDNETEAAIQRSLQRISVGRTTIIIAHRLSTVRNVDRICVLGKEGQIIEEGRHDELIDADGFYASLWRVQSGELPVEDDSAKRPLSRKPAPRRKATKKKS